MGSPGYRAGTRARSPPMRESSSIGSSSGEISRYSTNSPAMVVAAYESRALAPLDVRAAGQGTRVILENAARGSRFHEDEKSDRVDAHVSPSVCPNPDQDLPEQIQVITGWENTAMYLDTVL